MQKKTWKYNANKQQIQKKPENTMHIHNKYRKKHENTMHIHNKYRKKPWKYNENTENMKIQYEYITNPFAPIYYFNQHQTCWELNKQTNMKIECYYICAQTTPNILETFGF